MKLETVADGEPQTPAPSGSAAASRTWKSGIWLPFAAAVLGGAIGVQLTALVGDEPARPPAPRRMDPAAQEHVYRLVEAVVLGETDVQSRNRTLRYLITTFDLDERTRSWALGELTGFPGPAVPSEAQERVIEPVIEAPPQASVAVVEPERAPVAGAAPPRAVEPAARPARPARRVAPAAARLETSEAAKAAARAVAEAGPAVTPMPGVPDLAPPEVARGQGQETPEPSVAPPAEAEAAPVAAAVVPEPPRIRYAASLVEVDLGDLVDSEGVAEILKDRVSGLAHCYESAVLGGTDLAAGELEVGFRIANGRVARATPLFVGVDDEVVRCVVRDVRSWRFGRTSEGALSAWFQFSRA